MHGVIIVVKGITYVIVVSVGRYIRGEHHSGIGQCVRVVHRNRPRNRKNNLQDVFGYVWARCRRPCLVSTSLVDSMQLMSDEPTPVCADINVEKLRRQHPKAEGRSFGSLDDGTCTHMFAHTTMQNASILQVR